jgi:hypothetical protein
MKDMAKAMRNKARQQADKRRNEAMSQAKKRKEEFLGARVPKALRDKVIARAEEEGLPVSLLIRKILENALSDYRPAAAPSAPEAPGNNVSSETHKAPRFPSVLGWEEVRLNRAIACAGCAAQLLPGATVTLGLPAGGENGPVVLCENCKGLV